MERVLKNLELPKDKFIFNILQKTKKLFKHVNWKIRIPEWPRGSYWGVKSWERKFITGINVEIVKVIIYTKYLLLWLPRRKIQIIFISEAQIVDISFPKFENYIF